ncbi:MAG TPA: alkyl sulfatase dimerization domain-containing protein [Mesotoga sp.]|nr:MBL fold metallo-hydrolase [Mesotoga sp.]MDI9375683.1 alkyl sulfatase dimerization domain-containing protein [Thermotogota bacterium]NLX33140.1 MBL fold metallo-hydrolase [Thermotogaceae bacterium]MDD4039372.1 alkyl sulfatase dimerization domain-containing protein [Mesotoga sp.]MDD5744824.1 alkyl sulfatase dimerization domain-containing protein [Mesotoga sp.]
MRNRSGTLLSIVIMLVTFVFANSTGTGLLNLNDSQKEATDKTAEINRSYYSLLDFDDETEYEFATRGLIAAPETLELKDSNGRVVWSQKAYEFVDELETIPDTANPSLWRDTVLNHCYGLFEVCEGIYQVRGYDLTNLTLIETESGGWIIFDPLMSLECTEAAMKLVEENLGKRPVMAIVMSHPHADHFGGIRGVVREEEVADRALSIEEQISSGKVPIIVPEGFTEHAVSENLFAGTAMARRAAYQYGVFLEKGVKDSLAMGIGLAQSTGTLTFILPTHEIKETGEKIVVDGVEMIFQMTPGTEAPAEMNTYFPQFKALWMAENCTGTLHNLYTLRGAQVRDGNAWAKYILEAITLYGSETEVTFQSHNWPHWGNDVVIRYMEDTAAVYKFIHDQTLMYINLGYTSDEISSMIRLPEYFEKVWYTRQYYGTVAHNSKAVYQKYMGWYDANPVHLNPLDPSERARKFVEYLGDTDRVLEMAYSDFLAGEYQWVAEITNILVFADPQNTAARYLCADALEQLGYQSESGTWRNAYLTAALELRMGNSKDESKLAKGSTDILLNTTVEMMLDYMGILIDSNAAEDIDITFNLVITDTNERYFVHLFHGVLLYYAGQTRELADATLTCPKIGLLALINRNEAQQKLMIRVDGDGAIPMKLTQAMVAMDKTFNIVEP